MYNSGLTKRKNLKLKGILRRLNTNIANSNYSGFFSRALIIHITHTGYLFLYIAIVFLNLPIWWSNVDLINFFNCNILVFKS